MTQKELAVEVSAQTGFSPTDVQRVVEKALKEIKNSIGRGQPVFIRGFGSFTIKRRAAKKGRNIGKGIMIDIPAKDIPFFKPAPDFKARLTK